MATTSPPDRIVTLDIVRGVAVMGILAMNIVAFAMPFQAYMNPAVYGSQITADYASWAFNFVLVDGKMRGLFSFLFGASMLLVIEKAVEAGRSPARIHYARMFWLLVFGLIHFYFIWFGDILAGYAQIGMIAYLFRRMGVKALVRWGIGFLIVEALILAALVYFIFMLQAAVAEPNPSPELVQQWQEMQRMVAPPDAQAIAADLAKYRDGYGPLVHERLVVQGHKPFMNIIFFGAETLAYFLFGMALLKSGFLRGEWAPERYKRMVLIGYGIGIPAYAALAIVVWRSGFDPNTLILCAMAATVPIRPLMILATASLIILLTRRGGRLVTRIAAAGRAAFTNYLGTSILMTMLFYGYGLGLYGHLSRIELWIPLVATWALMLLWSKPWLDRFRYGPFEWLWRSLARFRIEPIRKAEPAAAPA